MRESYITIIFYLSLFEFIKKISYKFIKLSWLSFFYSFDILLLHLIFFTIFIARDSDIMPLPYKIKFSFSFTMIFNSSLPTTVSKMWMCSLLITTLITQSLRCLSRFLPKPFITIQTAIKHRLRLTRINLRIRCIFSLKIYSTIKSLFLFKFFTFLILWTFIYFLNIFFPFFSIFNYFLFSRMIFCSQWPCLIILIY